MTHILVTVDVAGPDIFPDKLICYGQRMGTKFMWRCLLQQGDINCGPSSHHDFIKNYFLSNILKFPLKFSISSQPGWQAGTIKATLTGTNVRIMILIDLI